MTTSTKSGLSNETAVRVNISSVKRQVGDQVCQSSRQSGRRLAASPARPRSVLKYHWYQSACSAAGAAGRGGAIVS